MSLRARQSQRRPPPDVVAVPLAATIGVLARFALRRYLESSLYTGGTG